jgi:hypothetical protein
LLWNRDTEFAQRIESIRHKSFAAGFIDRRNGAIRNHHAQAMTPRRDGGCQTSRAAANNENVPRLREMRWHRIVSD